MEKTSGQLELERIRQRNQIVIEDMSTCHYCKSTGLKAEDHFCYSCGFPQGGTQEEMKLFIWKIKNKEQLLIDKKKSVRKATNILFILAGLNLIIGIIMGLLVEVNILVLIASIVSAAIYLGLGLWSLKQPFPAILSGFFIYIVFNVLNAIVDPTTIYQGLLWKIIIISSFVYGYKGVMDAKKIEAELQSVKNTKNITLEN
jgi:ribosomal protein L37E